MWRLRNVGVPLGCHAALPVWAGPDGLSFDRYYAVLKPLHLTGVDRRGKVMLIAAWMGSVVCSMPNVSHRQ